MEKNVFSGCILLEVLLALNIWETRESHIHQVAVVRHRDLRSLAGEVQNKKHELINARHAHNFEAIF